MIPRWSRAKAARSFCTSPSRTMDRRRAAWRWRKTICWRRWSNCSPAIKYELVRRRFSTSTSENRRTHSHMRGAKADGHFEIGAHSHAELVEAVFRRQLGEKGKMRRRIVAGGWNAHQTDDRQSQRPRLRDQGCRLFRQRAGLLRLFAGIDLDKQVRTAPAFIAFGGQRPRQLGAVQGLNAIEQRRGLFHLVG